MSGFYGEGKRLFEIVKVFEIGYTPNRPGGKGQVGWEGPPPFQGGFLFWEFTPGCARGLA
jgi:hypothetical protein